MVVNETAYVHEAIRLREKYASQIQILIGFESDWIREESFDLIQRSLSSHPFEFFVGSVHHMHTIPIDFDRPMYEQARVKAGGTDELLFQDYFDAQLDMLQRLRPPVVGHFDLIRLKSDTPDVDFRVYPGVWERIIRNLEFIASYGGLMEVNSAALRKGMRDPYPTHEISREFLARKGRFCLSDDSHGVEQVGLNFRRVLDFLGRVGVTELYYLELREEEDGPDARFPRTGIRSLGIESVDSL